MDQAPERVFTIVLGARHLVLGAFTACFLFVALGGVGVVMVRAFLPSLMSANEPAPREQVLVVDADAIDISRRAAAAPRGNGTANAPDPPAAAATAPVPKEQPVSAPRRAALPPLPPAAWRFGEPESGQLFFQVLATNRAMASAAAEKLARRGLPCLVAAGNDERSFRVLVGPVGSKDQAETRERLEQLDYRPFLRLYKKTPGQ